MSKISVCGSFSPINSHASYKLQREKYFLKRGNFFYLQAQFLFPFGELKLNIPTDAWNISLLGNICSKLLLLEMFCDISQTIFVGAPINRSINNLNYDHISIGIWIPLHKSKVVKFVDPTHPQIQNLVGQAFEVRFKASQLA